MRIGLLSDTHGFLDERIFLHFKECDEIWHAGDIGDIHVYEQLNRFKVLRAVYGNIDGGDLRHLLGSELIMNIENVKVWMTHIAGYPPNYIPAIKARMAEIKPNLLICGHSHILRIMPDVNIKDFLYVNPGAAGIQGFHKVRTLVRFTIAGNKISEMQVIELNKATRME